MEVESGRRRSVTPNFLLNFISKFVGLEITGPYLLNLNHDNFLSKQKRKVPFQFIGHILYDSTHGSFDRDGTIVVQSWNNMATSFSAQMDIGCMVGQLHCHIACEEIVKKFH